MQICQDCLSRLSPTRPTTLKISDVKPSTILSKTACGFFTSAQCSHVQVTFKSPILKTKTECVPLTSFRVKVTND